MKPIFIEANDIPDAWHQAVLKILDHGFSYTIDKGSFEGQMRFEFDWISIYIRMPYAEPYDLMLPQIPAHLNITNPVAPGYIEQYLPYLMTAEKENYEDYTYGERLIDGLDQIHYWISMLRQFPKTNQAVLQLAEINDCNLNDPPCLRHIDMRVKNEQLIFFPYFRSNDLWSGFPANLAGIAVLQKYMADCIGVDSGPIMYSSKGLHIYGFAEDLVKLRCGKLD